MRTLFDLEPHDGHISVKREFCLAFVASQPTSKSKWEVKALLAVLTVVPKDTKCIGSLLINVEDRYGS